MLSLSGRNQELSGLPTTIYASAHNGWPSDVGLAEISGSGYARQLATLLPANQGGRLLGTAPTLTIPANETAYYIGFWTAATNGTFLGSVPVAGAERPYVLMRSTNKIRCLNHGYTTSTRIVFLGAGPGIPAGQIVWPVAITQDEFSVSLTQNGGSEPLVAPSSANGRVSSIVPHAYGGNGKLRLSALLVDMGAAVAQNTPPDWNEAIDTITLDVGQTFDLRTICTDADLDTLIFTLQTSGILNNIATLNPNGVITAIGEGDEVVVFNADDGR